MSTQIEFPQPREFLGRNGIAKMSGVLIDRQGTDLYVAPITSRGNVGRAYLLIPREQARALADTILKEAA